MHLEFVITTDAVGTNFFRTDSTLDVLMVYTINTGASSCEGGCMPLLLTHPAQVFQPGDYLLRGHSTTSSDTYDISLLTIPAMICVSCREPYPPP